MKKIQIINVEQYPQYSIEAFQYKSILNLSKKGIFQSQRNCIEKAIEKNCHYSMLGFMILLHEADKLGAFRSNNQSVIDMLLGPSKGTLEYKSQCIDYFWSAFFNYELTHNKKLLVIACKNLLEIVDSNVIDFWNACEINNTIVSYYDEKNINKFLAECEYIVKDKNKLGKVIYPNTTNQTFKKIKETLSPLLDNGLDFLAKKFNPISKYKINAETLKNQSVSILKEFTSLPVEERIGFAEYYLNEHCYFPMHKELLKNLKTIYTYNEKYKLNDIDIANDYDYLLNKNLTELINFVDLYKQQKIEPILMQIEAMNKMALKIKLAFDEDIQRQIRIGNRVLNHKNHISQEL